MSLQNEVRRGELARSVLENEVYVEAYALIEQEILRAWRDSRDKDEREELHRALRSLTKVKTLMEGVLTSGEIARKKLVEQGKWYERAGNTLRSVSGR